MVVGDADLPAGRGGRTGGGDVAADADEHAAASGPRGCIGGAIGGPGFGGRAEIQLDAGRCSKRAVDAIDGDRAPACARPC